MTGETPEKQSFPKNGDRPTRGAAAGLDWGVRNDTSSPSSAGSGVLAHCYPPHCSSGYPWCTDTQLSSVQPEFNCHAPISH